MARITFRVQPSAAKDRVVGRHAANWKIAVAAPPAGGRANRACIELLARLLRTPKTGIEIVRGASGRTKTFEIAGLDLETIDRLLERANS